MCDLLVELLGTQRSYAFLSGPSFAREVRHLVVRPLTPQLALYKCPLHTEGLSQTRSPLFVIAKWNLQIVENKATAVVIASTDVALATDLSNLMSSVTFRVFTTKDVVGLEVRRSSVDFYCSSTL